MTTRAINRFYDRALADADLRATGFAILSRLAAEGPLSISQLAVRLALERTTCSREIEPLARAGLVELEVGADRRKRVASLSGTGRKRLEDARPHWERAQRQVADVFGLEQTGELLSSLRELLRASKGLPA